MIEQLQNGAYILREAPYRAGDGHAPSRLVLALAPHSHAPFVTWVINDETGAALWGTYHETLTEAEERFIERKLGIASAGRLAA